MTPLASRSGETVIETGILRASLAETNRVERGDMLAALQLGDDLAVFLLQIEGNNSGDGLADHLLGRIAEGACRPAVPRGDDSVGESLC